MAGRLIGALWALGLLGSVAQAAESVFQAWNLESSPGWTTAGQWAFGTPTGGGGVSHGQADPTSGYTGTNVYGVNLNGDYSTTAGGPYYLTTGAINCTGQDNVTLRFRRRLNSDYQPYVYATVEVSNNNTSWTTVWSNGSSEVADTTWTLVSYNISSVAANKPTVYIRWGYQVASGAWAYSGWNIDDIELVSKTASTTPSFRAMWVDAFHEGFKSTADIDKLINRAVAGHYNAIIMEVLAYQDSGGSGHGAYWESDIVPRATDTGGMDALGYLIGQAHASGIEVHPWLVTYRVSATWPPAGNTLLQNHPEYLMVSKASIGQRSTLGGKFVLDPGSPDVQEYLISIIKEIATKYEVDGIHWDYVRYEQTDAGYPTDLTYARSGLARFRQITGYPADTVPAATGVSSWDDFRRREVTELVRRARAEIAAIRTNPRQPLRHTAALIPWSDAPSDFTQTSAYKSCYQDWRGWMEAGYLDAGCPMLYNRDHCSDQYTWYRHWVDASIGWRYARHMFCGQAPYLNSMENSAAQLQYSLDQGADGIVTYAYASTAANEALCDGNDGYSANWDWYSYLGANIFSAAVATPTMPWRNPATATEGTLYGRVTDSVSGEPIDNASVQVASLTPVYTDGNGYYVVTMLPAVAAGTPYQVTATTSAGSITHQNVLVPAGDVERNDFQVGPLQIPTIIEHPANQTVCPGGKATFSALVSGEEYTVRWQRDGADLVAGSNCTGQDTTDLVIENVSESELGGYRCVATNAAGSIASNAGILSFKPVTAVTQDPPSVGVRLRDSAQFTVQAQGVGLTYLWQKNGVDLVATANIRGVTTNTLLIRSVSKADLAEYRCVVTGDCGSATSQAGPLSVTFAPADYDLDGDVDLEDWGQLQLCLTGIGIAQTDVDCARRMMDDDDDIDDTDVSRFMDCLTGAALPSTIDCGR